MCLLSSGESPHSYVVFRRSLLDVFPVLSRLRHLHVVQFYLLLNFHLGALVDASISFTISLHRTTLAGNPAGCTEIRKQFRDCKRFSADFCPNSGWASFDSCFFFSTLTLTFFRISNGAIPASKYRSSSLDALRHSVISLQTLFNSGSRLDTEYQSTRAVILFVLAFVPH